MIKSVIITNKKGKVIELDFEEIQKLKDQLNELDPVIPQPFPTYYPGIMANQPWKQGDTVYCANAKTSG